jgi:RHS repeat-associated protein
MTSTDSLAPDPRSFGMLAPVVGRASDKLPSGLTRYLDITTSVSPSGFNPPTTNGTWSQDVSTNLQSPDHVEFKSESDSLMLITQSPLGRVTRTAVDAAGRSVKLTVKGLDDVEYAYDSHGHLIYTRQGKRGWSQFYDGSGRLSSIRDTLGRVTSFGYDAADRVTSEVLPDSQTVLFGYDANGNLASVKPPGRSAHTFDYTGVDLTSQYTPPDVGIGYRATAYSYNKDRQLTQVLRPDSLSVALSYVNGTDQLRAVSIPRGSVTYKYLASGAPDSVVSPDGEKLIFGYDGPLRLSETYRGPVIGRVERTYDPDFRPSVEMVDSSAAITITLRYNLDGLLAGAGVDSIVYRANDALPDSTSLAGFIATSKLDYDGAGDLANLHYGWKDGGSFLQSYARDGVGRITTLYEAIAGDTVSTLNYTYTTAGRLREVDRNGLVVERYDYDANGNRIAAIGPGGTADSASATYDGQDRLLRYGSTTYAYTKNGELKSKMSGTDTTTYTYDELGNLVRVVLPRPNMDRIDYLIDGRNRRVGRTVNGHWLKAWLYRDQLSPVAELDSTGAVSARYVYGSGTNSPDYIVKSGTTYRLVTDQLGSLRLVVDASSGTVAERIDYDAWGRVISDTNPGFVTLGYAGGIYDLDTRLSRFGARDYDASIGRWTCQDPAGFEDTYNVYTYVGDQPLGAIDPAGLHYTYSQSSGRLSHIDDDCGCNEETIGFAKSGHGAGLNNPAYNDSTNKGPISRGWYTIGPYGDHKTYEEPVHILRHSRRLTPRPGNPPNNKRKGFLMHPGAYSKGCILIDLPVLVKKANGTEDKDLEVVP